MKLSQLVLALACVALLAVPTMAAVVAYEGFNYTDGEYLVSSSTGGQDGGTGWADAWYGDDDNHKISGGKVIAGDGYNNRSFRDLADPITQGESIWFAMEMGFLASAEDPRFQVLSTPGDKDSMVLMIDGGGSNYDLRYAGGRFSDEPTNVAGQTDLFVAHFTFGSGTGDDTLELWINPTLGGAAPSGGDFYASVSLTEGLDIEGVEVYDVRVDEWTMDNIQFATDFADITPEPVTMALLGLGGAGLLVRRRRNG